MYDIELAPLTESITTLATTLTTARSEFTVGGDDVEREIRLEIGENDLGSNVTTVDSNGGKKEEENHEYITGFKLFAVLASVTLAAFLMLLDGSIIGVVS